jgi:hypothetical protein
MSEPNVDGLFFVGENVLPSFGLIASFCRFGRGDTLRFKFISFTGPLVFGKVPSFFGLLTSFFVITKACGFD